MRVWGFLGIGLEAVGRSEAPTALLLASRHRAWPPCAPQSPVRCAGSSGRRHLAGTALAPHSTARSAHSAHSVTAYTAPVTHAMAQWASRPRWAGAGRCRRGAAACLVHGRAAGATARALLGWLPCCCWHQVIVRSQLACSGGERRQEGELPIGQRSMPGWEGLGGAVPGMHGGACRMHVAHHGTTCLCQHGVEVLHAVHVAPHLLVQAPAVKGVGVRAQDEHRRLGAHGQQRAQQQLVGPQRPCAHRRQQEGIRGREPVTAGYAANGGMEGQGAAERLGCAAGG